MKKPNLIIAGTHKSGTTSLYEYLKVHNDVFAALKKEIHYYTPLIYNKSVESFDSYLKYFKDSKNESYLLEASPSYLYGNKTIINQLQRDLGTDCKIILLLRDPVKRFFSFYKQSLYMNAIDKDDTIDDFFQKSKSEMDTYLKTGDLKGDYYSRALREGTYSNFISDWIEKFGENLKIIYFEDLAQTPKEVMNDLTNWLKIENSYDSYDFSVKNQTNTPKNHKLHGFVLSVFFKFETFFRKNQWIKSFFKFLYSLVNFNKKSKNTFSSKVEDDLKEFYSTYNNELRQILIENNLEIKHWLKND